MRWLGALSAVHCDEREGEGREGRCSTEKRKSRREVQCRESEKVWRESQSRELKTRRRGNAESGKVRIKRSEESGTARRYSRRGKGQGQNGKARKGDRAALTSFRHRGWGVGAGSGVPTAVQGRSAGPIRRAKQGSLGPTQPQSASFGSHRSSPRHFRDARGRCRSW